MNGIRIDQTDPNWEFKQEQEYNQIKANAELENQREKMMYRSICLKLLGSKEALKQEIEAYKIKKYGI